MEKRKKRRAAQAAARAAGAANSDHSLSDKQAASAAGTPVAAVELQSIQVDGGSPAAAASPASSPVNGLLMASPESSSESLLPAGYLPLSSPTQQSQSSNESDVAAPQQVMSDQPAAVPVVAGGDGLPDFHA